MYTLPGDAEIVAPCTKILDFGFAGTYDSDSCYNFAKGNPYGEPELFGDVLYLNGQDQFLTVSTPVASEAFV
jgi:hypothetical protein